MAPRTNDSSPASSQQQHRSGRRVAFSDVSSVEDGYHRRRSSRCREPHCFACCAWVCLVVVAILLIGLLLACSLVFFLQSELPQVRVESCTLKNVNVSGNSQVEGRPVVLTNLGAEVLLNVSNKNDKVAVSFGVLKANVSWEDINLGQVTFPGFSQDPKVVKELKITTQALNSPMDKDDVDQLKKEIKEMNTVLTVVLSGTVGFHVGWIRLERLPLLIRCAEISQSALELGQDYKCTVRIYAFG